MSAKRIRGRRLQSIRRQVFASQPLCPRCEAQGFLVAATEVDHIVPLHKGGKDVPENRQPLCTECHKAKTADEATSQARSRKPQIGLDGWPVDN